MQASVLYDRRRDWHMEVGRRKKSSAKVLRWEAANLIIVSTLSGVYRVWV